MATLFPLYSVFVFKLQHLMIPLWSLALAIGYTPNNKIDDTRI